MTFFAIISPHPSPFGMLILLTRHEHGTQFENPLNMPPRPSEMIELSTFVQSTPSKQRRPVIITPRSGRVIWPRFHVFQQAVT